jgi:hypothetical protein
MSDDFNNREWTPAQEAQARQNAANLNASLTKASGFGEGGANRTAFENIGKDLSSKFGQLKNLKTDTATVKSQFGSMGEEPSVAISKSAGGSQESVEFPFDETKITSPKTIPEAFKGAADKFGSLSANIENAMGGSDLSKTLSGMFGSASTTMSSVIGGVGSGMTSSIGSLKESLTAAAKNAASLTNVENPEQKFVLKSNPFASLEDQASAFKAYATKIESELEPQTEQLKAQFGGLTNSLQGALNQSAGALGSAIRNVAGAASSAASSIGGILKSNAGGITTTLQGVGDSLKPRLPGLSTSLEKSLVLPVNSSSSASFADVIKQSFGSVGGQLSNMSNSVSADVLAARQSRAQLFPADALESKLKSVGESLAPSIAKIKDQIGSRLPEGFQAPGSGGVNIDQDQVNKDVTNLRARDPSITEAEARDQATRNQQLNNSLTKSFGFQTGGANRSALEQAGTNIGRQFNISGGG